MDTGIEAGVVPSSRTVPRRFGAVPGLAALEAFALAELGGLIALGSRLPRYVTDNRADRLGRQLLLVAPAAAAVVVFGVAFVIEGRRKTLPAGFARALERLRPILALWALPPFLFRGIFGENELFLMLAVSALVLGTEWSLRGSPLLARDVERAARAVGACRLPPFAAHVVAASLVLAVFAFACHGSIRIHDKMLTSNFDLGIFENLFWNTLHGAHGFALGRQYFAEHAELLLYALMPIYWLFPRTETLLALQSFFIVGAAVPLYLLANRWLRSGWHALVVVVAYLAYPSVHGAVFYDFHFLPLSVFFVAWGAFFYACRSWVAFWAAVVLAATCREDVALGIGAVGAGLVVIGRTRRLGAALAVFGGVWFAVVKFVWMERFGTQVFANYYADLIPPHGHGFGAVAQTVVSNPLYTLSRTLTEDKLLLALHLLAPLAFLPVRQRRTAVLLAPGLLVIGLATNRSAITEFQFHYSMHFVPYLFVGAVIALAVRRRTERFAPLTAMLVGACIGAVQFTAFFGDTFHASFQAVSFDWTRADAKRRDNFGRLARKIPANASVSAGEYEGPHLSRRSKLASIKDGIEDADYVVYSVRSLRWGGDEAVSEVLRSGSYGVVEIRGDLALLRRGAPSTQNEAALRMLEHRS